MYTNNRDAYRQAFFVAWQKFNRREPLEPVEQQLVEIMLQHPEYHRFLELSQQGIQQEFALEENPFFHMSLHMALLEQIRMNKPKGINKLYKKFIAQFQDPHEAQHQMMSALAQLMWKMQQSGTTPSDAEYLQTLAQSLGDKQK